MISKVIPADSVYHTCRYICNKPGAEVLITDGVREHDFRLMAEDFIRQQQLRPGKEKAFFHGIVSFHPSERPSNEMLQTIAGQYLQRLGIVNTQYSIVKHTDKSHLHLHIVANMIDNDGKVIKDNYIGLLGKKVAQQLTQEYKLIPAIKKEIAITNLENMNELEASRYKIYMAIAELLPKCSTMETLVTRLQKQGIDTQFKYKGQTQEIQGISFKMDKFSFKGSQVDRKFSFSGLQKALSQGINEKVDKEPKQQEAALQVQNPKQDFHKILSLSKHHSKKLTTANTALEKASDVLNKMNKVFEELLKSEETQENLSYNFSQEAYLRKKRKKQHKHKR
ncbi:MULTISPECIES: relaxase/mobilization nuclease domain-containing protein [Niastella]|uniref:Relaxase/mobilization nuclease domain-containing protein n=1 Tax=Niastella soli TaxID=2821487 RepID=A0ABS3YZ99_9BACT|nr:relaxase/mobilization nuclease domain-containing protein [Niastella soli]MBO9203235.1 relaxase/mobilization nuclease domain-containing protein [Niastella soli]